MVERMEMDEQDMDDWMEEADGGNDPYGMPDLDRNVSSHMTQMTRGFSYTMLEDVEIGQKQRRSVQEVMDMFCVRESIAKGLLLKYFWNKDKLTEDFFTDGNLV